MIYAPDIQYWSDGRCVYGEVDLGLHGLWRTATAISDRDPMLCRTVGLVAAMEYTQEVMERTVSEVLGR